MKETAETSLENLKKNVPILKAVIIVLSIMIVLFSVYSVYWKMTHDTYGSGAHLIPWGIVMLVGDWLYLQHIQKKIAERESH